MSDSVISALFVAMSVPAFVFLISLLVAETTVMGGSVAGTFDFICSFLVTGEIVVVAFTSSASEIEALLIVAVVSTISAPSCSSFRGLSLLTNGYLVLLLEILIVGDSVGIFISSSTVSIISVTGSLFFVFIIGRSVVRVSRLENLLWGNCLVSLSVVEED